MLARPQGLPGEIRPRGVLSNSKPALAANSPWKSACRSVHISTKGQSVRIQCGKSDFKIQGQDPDDFPKVTDRMAEKGLGHGRRGITLSITSHRQRGPSNGLASFS